MKAILDTNFILTCVKQKVDFFKFLEENGIIAVIPEEVIGELKKLPNTELALKILEGEKFETISIGNHVDKGIIELARKDEKLIIATLDKKLKEKFRNRKLVVKGKKQLEIIS